MVHPFAVLAIGNIETGVDAKMGFQDFDFFNIIEQKISEPFFATGFCKPHRLPADQHNFSSRRSADPVGMDGSRKGFAFEPDTASFFLVGCPPKAIGNFLRNEHGAIS
jgi:hypothetical protein